MKTVQAGSSNASVTVSFYDKDGVPTTPSSASYKVLGRSSTTASWQELRALTALTGLSTTKEIALDATDTDLIGAGPTEERRLCVYVDTAFWDFYLFRVVASECS